MSALGKAQLEQAIEQVRRQPGSPAYASLADHYLEQGNVDEAHRICRDGFASNPGFEKGALVYLAVLRRLKQTDVAGDVFGRAVAFLPRSAKVRVGWALILADAGKEREARHLAREALDLDPTNPDARALLATFGGTPAPTWRPPSYPGKSTPAKRPAKEEVEDSSLLEEEPKPPPLRAEVRPWIRPIGQRTTPHAMFDLTPAPMMLDPESRDRLRDKGLSIFDLTPSPDDEEQLVEDNVANLDVEVPADLFDDPYFSTQPPVAPQEELPPTSPVGYQAPAEELPTAPGGYPALGADDEVDPEDLATYQDLPTREVPLPDHVDVDSESFARTLEAASGSSPRPRGVRGPPPTPALPESDTPLPGVRVEGFPGVEEEEPPRVKVPWHPRPPRSPWRLVVMGVAALAVLGTGGFFARRYLQDRAVQGKVAQALALTLPDQPAGYDSARQQLEALLAARPGDARVIGALALVDAHLWARFSAEEKLRARAASLIAQAPGSDLSRIAVALIELRSGRPQQARASLDAVASPGRALWHFQLAAALAAIGGAQIAAAEQVLASAQAAKPASAAVLLEAATLSALTGRVDQSEQCVDFGLIASPGHVGLRLQQARLRAKRPGAEAAATVRDADVLEREIGTVARYRAALALLRGVVAVRRGDGATAVRLGDDAVRLDPLSLDAALQLATWQLGDGGDAAKALALFERRCPDAAACGAGVAMERAAALLRLGRPHEGRSLLGTIAEGKLADAQRQRLEELRVRAAHLVDDGAATTRLCAAVSGPRTQIACVEAALERSRLAPAATIARQVKDATAARYLAGLRAMALGDTAAAIARLEEPPSRSLVDPAAPLIALARAYAKQGNAAKATELLRRAVVRDARSAQSQVALASALVAGGHDTEALATLETFVAARPTQPSLLATAGETFLTIGQAAKASALVDHAMKHASGSVAVQLLAGRIALANKRTADAKSRFAAVLKGDPHNPEALVELGRIEASEGHGVKARQRFAAALRQRPKDPELLLLLARVHARGGDSRKAVASGLQAIKLLKHSEQTTRAYEVMVELGRLLTGTDRWGKARAEELFFEATKPQNAPATPFLELGKLHRGKGDIPRAIWCYRQAVERDPQLAEAQLELGLALRSKPQWRKEAKKVLRRYLQLRPQGAESARIRALVERMR
jgi:tetratricopeptide (TPR) repeat protein